MPRRSRKKSHKVTKENKDPNALQTQMLDEQNESDRKDDSDHNISGVGSDVSENAHIIETKDNNEETVENQSDITDENIQCETPIQEEGKENNPVEIENKDISEANDIEDIRPATVETVEPNLEPRDSSDGDNLCESARDGFVGNIAEDNRNQGRGILIDRIERNILYNPIDIHKLMLVYANEPYVIGIDVGTMYTKAMISHPANITMVHLLDKAGDSVIPTVVGFTDTIGVDLVGEEAVEYLQDHRKSVIFAGYAFVDAVWNKGAALPCNITPPIRDDRVMMVLWYRDNVEKPIYRFDVRGRALEDAFRMSDPAIFGPRAYFMTDPNQTTATLNIDHVQLPDEGIYRCRVDFRTSRTTNFIVNLTVIVPPNKLQMFHNSGRLELTTGVVGPLEEGSDLILKCEVRGGSPPPTVSWFINDRLVEGELLESINHYMVNRLAVRNLAREQLNSTFKCQASNTKLMAPVERTVRLELLLKPLTVKILNKPEEMVADKEYVIKCEVMGSRPRANVTWMRDKRIFRRGSTEDTVTDNGSVVNSLLRFAPVPEDDGTALKCRGENPLLSSGQEDSFKLNVVYPPQVTLHLGSTLNPSDIKEGDDVYFECNIRANPKQHKITWYHDGSLVSHNVSCGVIISSHSLVLQRVTRWQSGSYTCLASNPRGETISRPVLLRVRYAPVCTESEIVVIGASLDEVLKVRCHVSADPSDVTFIWQFNNSGENFEVSPIKVTTTSSNTSELMYVPSHQRDYGTLTCIGKNSIGHQLEPCVFQVVPASKPSPLSNCTLRAAANQSSDALEVECRAGYDGGLPQRFVLEAYDSYTMRMRLNLSSVGENPVFRIELGELMPPNGDGLPPTLRILVYSQNAKGRSEKVVLEDITLNDAEKRTDGSTNISILPLAALLTGSLLTLGIGILFIVVLAVRRRHRHCPGAHCNHQLDSTKQPKITPQPSRPSSMLEINTGDHRYVVAYTLKPVSDCATPINTSGERQPDILNTPRGTDTTTTPPNAGGPLPRPDALFTPPGDRTRYNQNFTNYQNHNPDGASPSELSNGHQMASTQGTTANTTTLGRPRGRQRVEQPFPNFATMRRDHIIADSIPGPESCV